MPPSVRWRLRHPAPMSCMPERENRTSARTSPPAMVSTNRWTAARRGRTSASRKRGRSAASSFTASIPRSSTSRLWPCLWSKRGTRRVQIDRWRFHLGPRLEAKGPSVGAADLAIAVDAPDILVAAMWEAHRPPWSTYAPIGGPGSGLLSFHRWRPNLDPDHRAWAARRRVGTCRRCHRPGTQRQAYVRTDRRERSRTLSQ